MGVLEVDHVMICVADPVRAIRALTARGFRLGSEGTADEQGTCNACFFFENAYIELVWVSEVSKLPAAAPIGLEARFNSRGTGACPIGFSVRPSNDSREWPFDTWGYSPAFLPAGALPIPVLCNSKKLYEPLAFISYFPGPPLRIRPAVPLQAELGAEAVTAVEISYEDPREPSKELQALEALGTGRFRAGAPRHTVSVSLDRGRQGQVQSFEPELPLVLQW